MSELKRVSIVWGPYGDPDSDVDYDIVRGFLFGPSEAAFLDDESGIIWLERVKKVGGHEALYVTTGHAVHLASDIHGEGARSIAAIYGRLAGMSALDFVRDVLLPRKFELELELLPPE